MTMVAHQRMHFNVRRVRAVAKMAVVAGDPRNQRRGKPNQLADRLQEKYGYTRTRAEREAWR
jgi:hypothetical protein